MLVKCHHTWLRGTDKELKNEKSTSPEDIKWIVERIILSYQREMNANWYRKDLFLYACMI
jgi:hypothetical protein